MDITAEEWNKKYSIGTPVRYWPCLGGSNYETAETRTEAWTLASGHHVVSITGRAGGVCLDNIEPLEDDCDDAVIVTIDQVIAMRKEIEETRALLKAANAVGTAKTKEAMDLKHALIAALDMLAKWAIGGGPLDPKNYGLTNTQRQEFDWLWTKIDNLVGDSGEYTESSDGQ